MKLSDSSEDQLIKRIVGNLTLGSDVLVGPGDDCAIVTLPSGDLQLLKTDCVVEGVHFYSNENAQRVGWKAIARVVSDIAAMGGTPQAFVVTLVLRADTPIEWLDSLYQGMQRCASQFSLSIVGGETSSAPANSANVISIAGTGNVSPEKSVLRNTSNRGDSIWVTGKLGGSLAGKHLDFIPRLTEAQWLVERCKPTAMMDLSDGLAKDLPRLAALSQLSYAVELDALPLTDGCSIQQALADGEDYELLFTLDPSLETQLTNTWPAEFPPISKIGTMLPADQPSTPLNGGWEHFTKH